MGEKDNGKNDNDLKEWSAARDVLDKFDERLHDLRKYGFSFVTALIAAEALLKSYTTTSTEQVPDPVKFVIILVTLGLIVALRLFDQYYQNFQAAAAIRASILETHLDIELTDAISYMFKDRKAWEYIDYIYIGFMILAGVFGVSILQPNSSLLSYLLSIFFMLIAVVVAYELVKFRCEYREPRRPIYMYVYIVFVILAGVFSVVFLPKVYLESSFVVLIFIAVGFASGFVKFISTGLGFKPKVDWTVYPSVCRSGELVRITLTNLEDENIQIQANENVWRIEYQDGHGQPIHTETNMNPINIGKEESYDWLWDTSGVTSEIYRVRPISLSLMNKTYHVDHGQGREWNKPPLRRKIYITPSEKKWWEIWK